MGGGVVVRGFRPENFENNDFEILVGPKGLPNKPTFRPGLEATDHY